MRMMRSLNRKIDVDAPTKAEIHVALKEMKNGTAGGVDNLTIEILKADLETSVDVLYYFLHKVWEQEQIPEDWQRGLIVKLPKKGDLTECNNWEGRNAYGGYSKSSRQNHNHKNTGWN